LAKANIETLAETLNAARLAGKPLPQLSKTLSPFPRDMAYSIQEAQLRLRQIAGENQIGWKMGLTSQAKREQMGLDSPLYGFLTHSMQVQKGVFRLQGSIHPKIEPEIAFRLKKRLQGNVTRDEVIHSCSGVAACMEILDSRYETFKYFSMEDVIADNSSSSHFVLGPWLDEFSGLALQALSMEMSINGSVVQKGSSEMISGDPVLSVVQLCALLAERGSALEAGSIVLAGAATAAVALENGMHVELKVEGLPVAGVRVE
jgi:2-oxo-3-hexenedioate decarboxylase